MKFIDMAVIGVYFGAMTLMGAYFSRRANTTENYFVGGRSYPGWLIGVSLFATLLSTISYLSMPGEMLGKGPVSLLSIVAFEFEFLAQSCVLGQRTPQLSLCALAFRDVL